MDWCSRMWHFHSSTEIRQTESDTTKSSGQFSHVKRAVTSLWLVSYISSFVVEKNAFYSLKYYFFIPNIIQTFSTYMHNKIYILLGCSVLNWFALLPHSETVLVQTTFFVEFVCFPHFLYAPLPPAVQKYSSKVKGRF